MAPTKSRRASVNGYVILGTNNFEDALIFYDALFSSVDANRLWKHGGMGALVGRTCFVLCLSIQWRTDKRWKRGDGRFKNDLQKSRRYASHQVTRTWRSPPGPRGDHCFYGGYFRDLDSNKLNAYVPVRQLAESYLLKCRVQQTMSNEHIERRHNEI